MAGTAGRSSAPNVKVAVYQHAGKRVRAVRTAREAVQDAQGAGRIQFKHSAESICSAERGGAIQVALRIPGQPGCRNRSIRYAREGVQDCLLAGCNVQLK